MWHLQMCGLVLDTITKLLKMAEDWQRDWLWTYPTRGCQKITHLTFNFFFKKMAKVVISLFGFFIVWLQDTRCMLKKNKLVTENVNWSVFPYNSLLSWFSIALPWTHGFKLVHYISISSCLFLITINKLPLEYFKTITQYNECSRESTFLEW